MPKLFGTNGIRGPADALFTKEFCIKLGQVFGSWLKNKGKEGTIAVAMDPRESSPRIKEHLCLGLASVGWEILDEGVIPTPALTYFVRNSPSVGGGVMITGSHITANLNGVKLLIDGEEVTKIHEQEIEELFWQITNSKSQNTNNTPIIKSENAAKELYLNMLVSLADLPYPKWSIAVDTANGTQTEIVGELFERLGLNLVTVGENTIQAEHFVPRDTETQGAVVDLIREVLGQRAALGVAFDVDGDRVVFVDELGRFVPGDYSCSLIAQESSSETIVTPISTSSVIDHIAKKVFRTKIGATHVVAKMKEVGATFGFEANGGGISSEIIYGRDGGSAIIKLLNILKKKNSPLSVLYNNLPKYYLFRDKLDCPVDKYKTIYDQVRQKYQSKQIEDLDGLKVHLSNSDWIMFRGSGNAPEFRVFTQSTDEETAIKLGHQGLEFVKSIITTSKTTIGKVFTDSMGILETIRQFPQQCEQIMAEIGSLYLPSDYQFVNKVVLSGMGGSALGGRVAASLERSILKVPLIISTEFSLPAYVDNQTLVIASSYSGNTEETLASLQQALAKGSKIVGIGTGGKLAQILDERRLPELTFNPRHNPSGQPRMGVGYSILSVLGILARCQLITPLTNLAELPKFLTSVQEAQEQAAADLSQTIFEKIPVLFTAEHLKGATHAVKNMLNENSKSFAAMFDLPEADHHLLEGLSFPFDDVRDLCFIFLESNRYSPELKKRFAVTSLAFAKQNVPVVHLKIQGESELFEVMWLVQFGMYVSYHLAKAYQTDPGPIPWVDYVKEQLIPHP